VAEMPLSSATSVPHGSRLVFHPKVSDKDVLLATKAKNWPFATAAVFVSEAFIGVLLLFFATIAPEKAVILHGILAATTVAFAWMTYVWIVKPCWCRRNVLSKGEAFWLPVGRTRQFYETRLTCINTSVVDAYHRYHLRANLYFATSKMLDQQRIADGDDTLLMYARTATTSTVARAEYDRLRDIMQAEIDFYVVDEPEG